MKEQIVATLKAGKLAETYADFIEKNYEPKNAVEVTNAIEAFKRNILPLLTDKDKEIERLQKEKAEETATKQTKERTSQSEEKDEKKDTDMKALIEAQNKQIASLTELVQKNQQTAELSAKRTEASLLLKQNNLPEGWISRIDLMGETATADQVKTLLEEYTSIRQSTLDEAVRSGNYSPLQNVPTDRSEADWIKLMNGEDAGGSTTTGKVDLGL